MNVTYLYILRKCIDEFAEFMVKYDKGIERHHFDLYFDALNANINATESGNEISSEQAWYLREKHLGVVKEEIEWTE